jgi:hypothetical protein
MNRYEQHTFDTDLSRDTISSVQLMGPGSAVHGFGLKRVLEAAGLSRIWREPEWSHYARLRFHGMNIRDAAEGAGKQLPAQESASDQLEGRVAQAERYRALGFHAREAADLAGFPNDQEVIQRLLEKVDGSSEALRIRYEQTRKWMGAPA